MAAIEKADNTLSPDEASRLDKRIDTSIANWAESTATYYLELAKDLHLMKVAKGYKKLPAKYEHFKDYLADKVNLERTYVTYLLRIAAAEGLEKFVAQGITGTKLIEAAKVTTFPDKIPEIIEATWEDVKDASSREATKIYQKYTSGKSEEFKKARKGTVGGAPKKTWKEKIETQFKNIPEAERGEYVRELQAYLRESGLLPDAKAKKTTLKPS